MRGEWGFRRGVAPDLVLAPLRTPPLPDGPDGPVQASGKASELRNELGGKASGLNFVFGGVREFMSEAVKQNEKVERADLQVSEKKSKVTCTYPKKSKELKACRQKSPKN